MARDTGGTLDALKAGHRVTIPFEDQAIVVRIMDSGGGRTNYYRVSISERGAYTLAGGLSSDRALTHIPITESSFSDILRLVRAIQQGG